MELQPTRLPRLIARAQHSVVHIDHIWPLTTAPADLRRVLDRPPKFGYDTRTLQGWTPLG